MEAFGIASSFAGLVSLGMTVCNGILAYYSAWKDSNNDVRKMYEKMELLSKLFVVLRQSIENPLLERAVVLQVEEHIGLCENGINALNKKLDKIKINSQTTNPREKTRTYVQRSLYPFRESNLMKLTETCNELRDHLILALNVLQM